MPAGTTGKRWTHDELPRRVVVAVVGIAGVAVAAYLGPMVVAALAAGLAALAAWEFYGMIGRKGIATLSWSGMAWAACLPVVAGLAGTPGGVLVAGVPLAFLFFLPGALRLRPQSGPAAELALTVFGAAYPGVLLSFAVLLRALGGDRWEGMAILFLPLVAVWIGDTAAYFVGRRFGRRALAPTLSPRKTWEGAVAGFLGSVLAVLGYAPVARRAGVDLSLGGAAFLGAVVAIAGQAGDLVESLLKRDCGVKNSSELLPGHGGVLDRVDSLLFALPVAYLFLRLR